MYEQSIRPENRPIDPRSPRFGAAITFAVLALALILGPFSAFAGLLLGVALIAFAVSAFLGMQASPYGWLFRRFVRPRLGPPTELEDPRPPRFAQAVGLIFALFGAIGVLFAIAPLFYISVGFALAAAFLNSVFGYCLGCEVYLLIKRSTNKVVAQRETTGASTP